MGDGLLEVVSWDDTVFMIFENQTIKDVILRRTVIMIFLEYARQFFGLKNPRRYLWEFHNLKTRERENPYHVTKE